MSDELPQGWETIALGGLFDFKYGKGLPQEKRNGKGSVRVYGSNGVVGIHDATVTSGPTIIVGRKGSVGEVHLSSEGCWPIDTTYFIDEFPANLPPAYWALYLKSLRLGQQEKSSAIPGISRDDIYAVEVPLPPLAEQRRIVVKVDKLLGKVDACQQRLVRIPVLLKRFRQSVLAAACSGRLTADWREENTTDADGESVAVLDDLHPLPETWRWQHLESVCARIVDCPHSTPKWADSGRLCVRTTNFRPGVLDLSEVRYVSGTTFNQRIERMRPQPGDVLYSREGGILGIACMIPPKVELCLGQRMMLFRVKSDFSASMLMHWLNSPVILRRVQELTGGSASPHLNVRDIKAFPTPSPPLAEQQEIVRRVEALFALADQIEGRFRVSQTHLSKLTPSLLAKAFRGELVPQDPNDEPAEQLLQRLRATKASSAALSRTGRKGARNR